MIPRRPGIGVAAALTALVAACGSPSPATTGTPRSHGSASPAPVVPATPQLIGTTRTVLAPLGLNFHSAPVLTGQNVTGDAQRGTSLTVLDYRPDGGGWFKVQGQTETGWIVDDPTLTAPGTFTLYQSTTSGFSALYPDSWSFQQEGDGVVFLPQAGSATQSAIVETAANLAAFGPRGLPGYTQSFSQQQVVCGYTGALDEYTRAGSGGGTTPSPIAVPRLSMYAEIRLTFDSTHALLMGFNYASADQLGVFADMYNSITFPYPLCEAPAATPSPSP